MTKYLKTKYVIENVSTDLFELLPLNDILIVDSTQDNAELRLYTVISSFGITFTPKEGQQLPGGLNPQTGLAEGESLADLLMDAVVGAFQTKWREVVVIPTEYNNVIEQKVLSGGNWSYPGISGPAEAAFIKSAEEDAAKAAAKSAKEAQVAAKEAEEGEK